MITFLSGVVVGAIGTFVVLFFVYRNNVRKFKGIVGVVLGDGKAEEKFWKMIKILGIPEQK
jgi:hypothetical protein